MHDPEALLRDFARSLSRGAFGRRSTARSAREDRGLFEGPAEAAAEPAGDAAVEEGEIRSRRSARVARPPAARSELAPRERGALAEPTARLPFSGDGAFSIDGAFSGDGAFPGNEALLESRARPEAAAPSATPDRTSSAPERELPLWSRHPALGGGGGFETFAVDEENRLAFRAVLETAQRPGALAKLVFLHGVRGTGKTHLLRACSEVLAARGLRVVHRDAERLTQEFTSALAEGRADTLLEALSTGDAILLDEVHRLGQRKATRAFAARLLLRYLETDRLVLVASRYHPRQIHGLEERQISLFLSGFSVQVRPPAEATKERWLRQRHRLLTREEPPRELHRLSRAIRGGLGDLAAAHDRFLFGAEIEELAGLFGEGMPAVIAATAERLDIDAALLGQRASSRALSRARDIASHVALRLGYRAEIVGRHLGGRRPQTVRAAARRVAEQLDAEAELRAAVESILMRLSG